jgi:Zinc-binding dehydrogenase
MLVEELGFDGAVDYKRADLRAQLREKTPDRVDIFFDNVGGEILDEGLTRLRRGARVVICGAVSQYNASGRVTGPGNYMALLVSRASMTGLSSSTSRAGTSRRSRSCPAGSAKRGCGASRTPCPATWRCSRACSRACSAARTRASSHSNSEREPATQQTGEHRCREITYSDETGGTASATGTALWWIRDLA